jgi:2-polyprenyl-6-methoxyphenol hydroxylase-like FAD-dependent oxidoreductase
MATAVKMAQKPLSILISGSGVAGASLALMLARHPSFTMKPIITLVERSSVPRISGQAVDVRGSAVEVIRQLGIEPDVKARHTTETGLAILNGQGSTIATLNATGDTDRQSITSEYEILRGELVGLLLDGVNKAKEEGAQVDIVHGENITHLEDYGDGVHVKFANGKLHDQDYDVVVAADGSSSRTRTMIFGKEDQKDPVKPTGMYVAFLTIPRLPQDDKIYKWCMLPNGMAMHLRPHRNPKTMGLYLVITKATKARDPEMEAVLRGDIASQKAYLKERFQDAGWQSNRFVEALDGADDFYMTHWCQVVTPKWTKERCVILGDAAFATMGVGTSLAMTGAYTIAGELSKIESSKDVSAALKQYEEIFRPLVAKHEKPPPGFPQLASPQTAWGVTMLHSVIRVVAALRLPQLAMKLFGGEEKNGWVLPDYGWKEKSKRVGS